MKWFIPAVILLCGCAGKEIVKETVEVSVPVPVACIDAENIPDPVASASETVTIDSAPGEKIQAVLIERERLRAQNGTLRALLESCIKNPSY